MSKCWWTENEDGYWDTSCDNAFEIIDGTPAENNFKFCCYCGGQLVQVSLNNLGEAQPKRED